MIGHIIKNHPREWPVTMMWYTKHAGQTIERIIDTDLPYFEWMVRTFLMVTPDQAEYYKHVTGNDIPKDYVMNVEPYSWQKGDPEDLYIDICRHGNIDFWLEQYRKPKNNKQIELFV